MGYQRYDELVGMIRGLIRRVIQPLTFGVIRRWCDKGSDTWCDKLIHGMIRGLILGIARSITRWV